MKQMVKDYVYGIVDRFQRFKITGHSAQSAFFIMMSIIPFFLFLVSIVSLLNIDESVIVTMVEGATPYFFSENMQEMFDELFSHSFGMITVAAIAMLWSAAKAVQGITYGLNCAHDIPEKRNYFYLRFQAMANTLVFLITIAFIIIFIVYGSGIRSLIHSIYSFHDTPVMLHMFMALRYLIAYAVLVCFFSAAYTSLPNRESKFIHELPSGFFCALSWLVFSTFLGIYVRVFNGFSIYGSLIAVILMMLWLYTGMMIFFVCAMIQPMVYYLLKYAYVANVKKENAKLIPIPQAVTDVCNDGIAYAKQLAEDKKLAEEAKAEAEAAQAETRSLKQKTKYGPWPVRLIVAVVESLEGLGKNK